MPHAGFGVSLSILLLAACPPVALAQPTIFATVTTTADGSPAVAVQPGTPVRLRVILSHTGATLAGIAGGTAVAGNAGAGSNFSTTIPSLPTVILGSFVGGSRLGADIANPPPSFGPPSPPFGTNPMPVWQYDLTLNEPGVYEVNWVPAAFAPNVRIYRTISSFTYTEAQTTYVGATITVLPPPASLTLLALFPLTARRRRPAATGGL